MPDTSPDDGFVHAADLSSLVDGEMRQVDAGGHAILLARVDGAVHAVSAFCTHYGAPLATGVLHGTTVVCPWHHACFDIATGALEQPPAQDALRCFETRLDGDRVLVRVPDDADAHGSDTSYRESDGRPPSTAVTDTVDDRLIVVLGGGAAGSAAVEELRGSGYRGRLALITRETHAPYDRTKLSKGFLAGNAGDDALPLRDGAFYESRGIEVWTDRRVTALDPEARTLTFEHGDPVTYDACLVATGGVPRRLDLDGADLDGVHVLRSWADAHTLAEAVVEGRRAVVIGASFIGMEAASSLTDRGVTVSVIDRAAVPFETTLGADVGGVLKAAAVDKGVTFHLEATVDRIERVGELLSVVLASGERVEGDVVLLGVGVEPATAFLSGAAFHDPDTGALDADETLRLTEGLFAAGDVVRVPDARLGRRVRIEHWRLAQQHGRVAARNLLADPDPTLRTEPFTDVPFFWTGQFGVSLRYVGHAEEWDEVIVDGSLGDRSFVAYYVAGGSVVAAAASGRDQDAAAFHLLLMQNRAPSPDEVRGGVDLQARLSNDA